MTGREKSVLVVPRKFLRHLDEALSLAETAGYEVASIIRSRYEGRIKKGLLESISRSLEENGASTVIYYGDLKPSSVFILAKSTRARVVDRVMLILEIFAKHASSKEAQLQIEAARIRHELPLVRELVRRSKMSELPGFLGPGKYAVDEYYRHLTRRLAKIRRELEGLRSLRESRLRSRARAGMFHVGIVGYASAGKTSLFNALTGHRRPVGPEYFTTLHPKYGVVRGLGGLDGRKVVAVDTVGFIRDVPPEIVEAFHATLAEIKYSDAIVFVVDASEPPGEVEEKVRAGFQTLARIGAIGVPTILAVNKVDAASDPRAKLELVASIASKMPGYVGAVPTSAVTGEGLDLLRDLLALTLKIDSKGGSGGRR
ncbi:MAG: GTPase HflX [Desulfurococcales archaeon]|nr:GTPase HflX [Desulfurococcales archaeon]